LATDSAASLQQQQQQQWGCWCCWEGKQQQQQQQQATMAARAQRHIIWLRNTAAQLARFTIQMELHGYNTSTLKLYLYASAWNFAAFHLRAIAACSSSGASPFRILATALSCCCMVYTPELKGDLYT
jgi:hypothetical protein